MPTLRAASYVRHCPRCLRPIMANAPIELYYTEPDSGRKRYAHQGCSRAKVASVAARETDGAETNGVAPDVDGGAEGAPPVIDLDRIAVQVRDIMNGGVERLKREVGGDLARELGAAIDAGLKHLTVARGHLEEQIRERLTAIEEMHPRPVVHVFRNAAAEVQASPDEVFHPAFDLVLRLAMTGEPVFMPGPTGSGKTTLAQQVAKYIPNPDDTFGRDFGMISCYLGMPDSELLGRSIPNIQTGENVYHPSDFVRCYENGGVFLLDEVDAGDANILLRINAAIANGVLAVPARTGNPYARKHPLFVLLFAANTFGTGADRRYVGRNQLDEATLDRVRATTVPVGYAEEVEKRLCPNDKVYGLLVGFRKKVFDNSLERIVSTRLLAKAYKLVCQARACSMAELLASLFGGWTDEEMTLVLGEPFSPKKWAGWEP